MKNTICAILILLASIDIKSQNTLIEGFYQASSNYIYCIIVVTKTQTVVYNMGQFWDKVGRGHAIKSTDTLGFYKNGQFGDKDFKYKIEGHKMYFIKNVIKPKILNIVPITDSNKVNYPLNNAYFLGAYSKMSDDLNKRFPYSLSSFNVWQRYKEWELISNKNENYLTFKKFASNHFKLLRDSILTFQEKYVFKNAYINNNIENINYEDLKDSITDLIAEPRDFYGYKDNIIYRISSRRPELFFKLAEDFSDYKIDIFNAAEYTKEVFKTLKNVPGFETLKLEFFKGRKPRY